MSDLAPFVASVLRDKVMWDLQDEIRELRERHAKTLLVQVKDATTIYGSANFVEGNNLARRPGLWEVFLTCGMEGAPAKCKPSDLPDLEIMVGGIQITDWSDYSGALVDDSNVQGCIEVAICMRNLWLVLDVEMDDEAQLRLRETDYELAPEAVVELCRPDASIWIREVAFFVSSMEGFITNVGHSIPERQN